MAISGNFLFRFNNREAVQRTRRTCWCLEIVKFSSQFRYKAQRHTLVGALAGASNFTYEFRTLRIFSRPHMIHAGASNVRFGVQTSVNNLGAQ